MSRRFRTKIPVATSLFSPKIVNACANLTKFHSRRGYYYNRANSKSLPRLRGDVVCQGSATPGTRATGGTREDFLWHAK